MNKGQIGVIDFDLASLGDPAFDVGNFHPAVRSARVLTGEVR